MLRKGGSPVQSLTQVQPAVSGSICLPVCLSAMTGTLIFGLDDLRSLFQPAVLWFYDLSLI